MYRAAVGTMPPRSEDQPWEDTTTRRESVPADIVSVFRTTFDLDVADVAVHRGPGVGALATSLSARAFATGGEVFLPDNAGDLGEPTARGLLVHELVHAAQQRVLGADLPMESSAEGAELEAVAAGAERWFLGVGMPPAALVHRPPPPEQPVTTAPGIVQRVDEPMLPLVLGPFGGVRSPEPAQPDVTSAGSGVADPPLTWSEPLPGNRAEEFSPAASQESDVHRLREEVVKLSKAVAGIAGSSAKPVADPTDEDKLEELADRLYDRVRTNLRTELLVDRERAGLLTDLR